MNSADHDVVGLYWTLSGPGVEIHTGREWSIFDFDDRRRTAASVGFRGIGLWHADLAHILETRSLDAVARILGDNGLRHVELEFLMDWFVPYGDDRRTRSDEMRMFLFEAAAVLSPHHIKVGNGTGAKCSISELTDAFGELCAEDSQCHDAKIVYELWPGDANVRDLDTMLKVVVGAGATNGGAVIDTWHMGKLGITPHDLRCIPSEYLSWTELSDGPYKSMDDVMDEASNHRRLPGEGEFDLPGYIAACRAMGYAGPWGVEVPSIPLRELPMHDMYRRAYETTAAQLASVPDEAATHE